MLTAALAISLQAMDVDQDSQDAALVARIEAIERENRELRAELDDLRRSRGVPAAPVSPIMPSTSVPPVENSAREASVFSAPRSGSDADLNDPSLDWNQTYFGAQFGWGKVINQDNYQSNFYSYSAPRREATSIGLQLGERRQFGALVIGAEMAVTHGLGDQLEERYTIRPPFSGAGTFQRYLYHRAYAVSLKADVGLAIDATFLYAGSGIDASRIEVRSNGPTDPNIDKTPVSPFIDVGVARKFGDHFVAEVEGRYLFSQIGLFQDEVGLRLKLSYVLP